VLRTVQHAKNLVFTTFNGVMAYTKKNKKNKNGDNCIAAVDIPTLCCKSVSAIIYFVSFID